MLAVCAATYLAAACVTDVSNPGCVHFEWKTSSLTDPYTNNPTATQKAWLTSHMYRIMWYSGYGDTRVAWFPNSWMYRDSSAIYTGNTSVVTDVNSSWFLYDANCVPLFINWGCTNGTCPQYAPNYASPGFLSWWIQQATTELAPGYKGIFIDDVNLSLSLSNGSATDAPMDPNTGVPMTAAAWEKYIADFMTQVRQAFPKAEITHNAQWFAGNADPSKDAALTEQIKAANYINIERGFADTGLVGDGSFWSIQNLFAYIDQVHGLGTRIIAEQYKTDGEFSLAAYFLVNSGGDLFAVDSTTPDNWPAMYDVDLGAATAARYTWNKLIRRDFANGIVLLNPPGAASVTVTLPGSYKEVSSGTVETSTTLPARSGAILLTQQAATPPPPPLPQPPPPPPPVTQPIPDGAHTIQNAYSTWLLDDSGWSRTSGQQMIQWQATGGTNQEWIFAYNAATQTYTIQNQYSQLYLADVSGKVEQVTKSTATTQQWTLIPAGGAWYIKNVGTSKVLDDSGFSTAQGAGIITWAQNNGKNQQWLIK